eukprot:SAG11_NODE_3032_length_2749_cov_8.088679_4_plen_144_part_00
MFGIARTSSLMFGVPPCWSAPANGRLSERDSRVENTAVLSRWRTHPHTMVSEDGGARGGTNERRAEHPLWLVLSGGRLLHGAMRTENSADRACATDLLSVAANSSAATAGSGLLAKNIFLQLGPFSNVESVSKKLIVPAGAVL